MTDGQGAPSLSRGGTFLTKRYRVALAFAAATALSVVVWLALPPAERSRVYEGKPLDFWVLGYRSPEPPRRKKGIEITRQAGTNAIPTLLRMLRAHDPPFKRTVMEFIVEWSAYRISYANSDVRNAAAANACEDLGEKARAAVPAFIELSRSQDTYIRAAACNALRRIDPDAAAAAGVKWLSE